jgi:3,4-dihydroxy 2-butanone 4-phosphate synthase/GTP cyclohydrolase II
VSETRLSHRLVPGHRLSQFARGNDAAVAHVVLFARLPLPTPMGQFDLHAYEVADGDVYLALVVGAVDGREGVLTRVHSECLTGDVLGSLRCDCGVQLRTAMRAVAAEGAGVVVYATGHEGRGIGLRDKLRAYMVQDAGVDTLDANVRLGLPADARRYDDAAGVIEALGIRSIRLLSNNPGKREGLEAGGVRVDEVVPLPTAAHLRNVEYLRTKHDRMGHRAPAGEALNGAVEHVRDVSDLLGTPLAHEDRPYVLVKLAQTLDGRVATATGDSRWISGIEERRVSHTLRAAVDAVAVGIGTVLADDPQLTVRLVPGASPVRVVLDARLRIPTDARVLDEHAATSVYTTGSAPAGRRMALRSVGAAVRTVPASIGGLDLAAVLHDLRRTGVRTLLVEGGARLVTSLLAAGLVDRAIVSVSPMIFGAGRDAIGELGTERVRDALRLANRTIHLAGDDVLIAGDLVIPERESAGEARNAGRSSG